MTRSSRRAMTWTLVALGTVLIVLAGVLVATAPMPGPYGGAYGHPFHRGFLPGYRSLGGWLIAGFVALRILAIAFVVTLVARIATGIRGSTDNALQTADRRFAAGEITEEELRHIREVLRS